MAQQSARRGGKNQVYSSCPEHAFMIWSPVCELPYGPCSFIAASLEAGQMAASDYVSMLFKKLLASRGASTDEYTAWLKPDGGSVQVVGVGALDLHRGDLAHAQRPARRHIDGAVDLGRIALAAALGDARADLVDDHLLAGADLALEAPRRDRLLVPHEAVVALGLDLLGHGRGEIVGGGAAHRLILETADAIESGFVEPVEQDGEILLGLAREADDEGRAQRDVGADLAPARDARERLLLRGGAPHAAEHVRRGVLKRHVEIGQHLAVGHQRDHVVDMRVG